MIQLAGVSIHSTGRGADKHLMSSSVEPSECRRPLSLCRALTALVVAIGFASSVSPASAAVTCDRVAAPTGSNFAAGTLAQPFQTVQKLSDSLAPGQTGCLRSGDYSEDVTIRQGGTAGAPVVIQSYPGERATIAGRLRLASGADYVTIGDLKLLGLEHGHACATMCASPTIDAAHTTFRNDDVTNNHADAICFLLGDANGVYGNADYTTIEDSRIHDCGVLPASNLEHGIYVEETHGSQIVNDLIYDNADRGIQLYPQAESTLIEGNIIYGNGEGVDFGARGRQTSSDNIVAHNIISHSNVLYNVLSAYGPGDQVGHGNVVHDNCIGGGAMDKSGTLGGIGANHDGFDLHANVIAVPLFADPGHGDFRLVQSSPCGDVLSGGSGQASGQVPTQSSVVDRKASARGHRRSRVRIRVASIRVRGGRRLVVRGWIVPRPSTAARGHVGASHVVLNARVRGRWVTLARGMSRANGTFLMTFRSPKGSRSAPIVAYVSGLGRSNAVKPSR